MDTSFICTPAPPSHSLCLLLSRPWRMVFWILVTPAVCILVSCAVWGTATRQNALLLYEQGATSTCKSMGIFFLRSIALLQVLAQARCQWNCIYLEGFLPCSEYKYRSWEESYLGSLNFLTIYWGRNRNCP